MPNDFYSDSGNPASNAQGSSANVRAEFALVEAGFDKMPALSGNGNKAVVVNAGGTALSLTAAALALAVALTTAGTNGITLTSTGATSLTLPTTGTLATLAGAESLSNKTIVAANLTGVTQIADGSGAAPSLVFNGATTTGFFRGASAVRIFWAMGGAFGGSLSSGGVVLKSTGFVCYGSDDNEASAIDLYLARDAANSLAQRNSTNAQRFSVYNTYTDPSNYERFSINWSTAANIGLLTAEQAGTGTQRSIGLNVAAAQIIGVYSNGTRIWQLKSATNSHLLAETDNTNDIGASGANRPRTGYFGTSVATPLVTSNAASQISFNTSGGEQFRIGHVASAVNYLQISGAATTAVPAIVAKGSDTNVSIAIGSQGTGRIAFVTDSGASSVEQFRITHTAGAVNYLQVSGSATTEPQLSAAGSDSAVSVNINSKGGGVVRMGTGAGTGLIVATTGATPVNYLQSTGNATGSAPILSAAGSDTDIDLALTPKGTGVLRFGTRTALGAETLNGYITIKDAGGTTRKLAVIA